MVIQNIFRCVSRVLFSGLVVLVVVSLTPQRAWSEQPAEASYSTVKIGALLPLSGALARSGIDIQRGIELALEDLGGQSPIRFQMFYEDTQFSLQQTMTAATKLITQDRVDVLLSLWEEAETVAPLAERAKVLHVSIRWNPNVTQGKKFTFTLEGTYHSWVTGQIELMRARGIRSYAIMQDESAGNEFATNELVTRAKEFALVRRETFSTQSQDYRSVITKVLAKKPDLIVIFLYPPALQAVIKQIRTLAPEQRLTSVALETVPQEELALADGAEYVALAHASEPFSEKFEKRFGEPFFVRAPHGYEFIRLLETCYRQNHAGQKALPERVAECLRSVKAFPSSLGELSANGTQTIENPIVYKTIRHGVAMVIPRLGE